MTVVLLRLLGYKLRMLLFTPDKVYQLDKAAVEQDGFAEIELMQRAGRRVWQAIAERWPQLCRITVFAGAGNNGGDAFVVALSARREGVDVQLLIQGDLSRQSETSRHFRGQWEQAGGEFEDWNGQELSGEVIVDGLLGIGLQRELDDHWQTLIETINGYQVPRIAIDIPSGLNGLTGNPQPVAVEAQLTVTFIGAKTGQYIADGPDYCGELIYEDLVTIHAKEKLA
jgi:NAD(P)H-hydrate epimerase